MRLIDADCVKSKLNKSALGGHLHYYVCGVIDDAPTVDAEPVKYGRWITDDSKIYLRHKCSECGNEVILKYPYCENCGAKMDLKDGESE